MLKTQLRTDALPTEKSSKKIETELKRLSVFARKTGYFFVIDYFSAIRDTKAVDALTSEKVINFAKGIGPDAARAYFDTIRFISVHVSYDAVDALTSEKTTTQQLMNFVKGIGPAAAMYFVAIGITEEVDALTNEKVMNFVKAHLRAAPARKTIRRNTQLTGAELLMGPEYNSMFSPLRL